MTLTQMRIMTAYFEASEKLADATDAMIKAHEARRAGLMGNCARFEDVAKMRLVIYREARAEYEGLWHKD